MLRKLIALLVLVTGLAALGQPAQARIVDVDSVGLASLETGYACSAKQGAPAAHLAVARERDETHPKMCPKPPRIVLIVPTVMLQADRARE
ncbi:MAG TPA: hypothetical protein VEB68_01765 [Croceibacterium sp.]|nr:hypothetical protein [Solirubrobacterales bacterium]HYD23493.1 hypothetical protein [Croceibacterium sp.]